jgi:hypothetical protein
MELSNNEQKVIRKVVRYFHSLEEMAEYLGVHVDELAGRFRNQNIKLTLEKKNAYNNSRARIFKSADEKLNSPLFNYSINN